MTNEDKIAALVGEYIQWADFDGEFIHLETVDGLMFHIPCGEGEIEVHAAHKGTPN